MLEVLQTKPRFLAFAVGKPGNKQQMFAIESVAQLQLYHLAVTPLLAVIPQARLWANFPSAVTATSDMLLPLRQIPWQRQYDDQ